MRREAVPAQTTASGNPPGGDLSLRLELLRTRLELDRVRQLLGSLGDSKQKPAANDDLPNLVAAFVSDSRELSQLKASHRYRLATLLALATRVPLRAGRKLLWVARSTFSRFRRSSGQQRSDDPGSTMDIEEHCIQPLPATDALPQFTSELRIAAVLDPFSASSFAPECSLELLEPSRWADQIRNHNPHLMLVESAWTGQSGEWKGLVERASPEIRLLVMSCRRAGIPTVFWNKEDPLHFGAFLETARLFDHVLTTDSDCVPRYRRLLGHDRVGIMPFGVQTAIHHPISAQPRQASSVFAGAWYGRMPDRSRDFTRSADALALAAELAIYDRSNGHGDSHQRFPRRYQSMLRPAVTYGETGDVFRGHLIGLNLNTIKSSPTMFARRALELAACGTTVYSNYSLGLQLLLADSVVASDEPERLLKEAWAELRNPDAKHYRVRRLQALRTVMKEHTWAHRLQLLGEVALGGKLPRPDFSLAVVGRVSDQRELGRICEAFARQNVAGASLVLDAPAELSIPEPATRLEDWNVSGVDWVALFHPDDYYGPHYLSDLVMAAKWELGDYVGKGAWHRLVEGRVTECNAENEYRFVGSLALRRMIFRSRVFPGSPAALLDRLDSGIVTADQCVSVDSWEYLEGGAQSNLAPTVSIRCSNNIGMQEVVRMGALLPAQEDPQQAGAGALDGAALVQLLMKGTTVEGVSVASRRGRMELCSVLDNGETAEWTSARVPRRQLEIGGVVDVCLQAAGNTSTLFRLEAVGASGTVLESSIMQPQVPVKLRPGADVHYYRFAISVRGPLVQEIDGIWIGVAPVQPLFAPGEGRLALVCNAYPDYRDLYRNAFLHRRVLAYQERGVGVDIFVVKRGSGLRNYEYEGALVRECPPERLRATLEVSGHAAVAVHFMDPDLWDAVRSVDPRTPLVVWLHGAEVQAWEHRAFNHRTAQERAVAKQAGRQRAAFWKSVVSDPGRDIRYVFVSDYLAEQTWHDLGVRPPDNSWSVIHNPIDTRLFNYQAKPAAMAKRILSIRPHASRIYANDLVAATIHRLAEEEIFPDLHFTLVGDGDLWEENFRGLERYPNVTLVREFLSQSEIAELHRQHGVFLVPTRGDTQGVSRDEAMSSGLVPVTNGVGAVPEFVDPSCAELCPSEDVEALAAAVLRLASDPERFASTSARASAHVERKSGLHRIIGQELATLGLLEQLHHMCCTGNRHQNNQAPVS